MVSAAIIKKLAGDIGALEGRLKASRPFKTVFISFPNFLDEDAIKARHYEIWPEDADPDVVIMTRIHCDLDEPYARGDNEKSNAAWIQIAAEERAVYSSRQLARLWAARALDSALVLAANGMQDHHYVAREIASIATYFKFPEDEALAMMKAAGIDISNAHVRDGYERGRTDHALS